MMGLLKKEIILLKTNLIKNPSNFENKKISVRTFYLPFFICTIIFLTHLLNIDSRELFGLETPKNRFHYINFFSTFCSL